MPQIIDPSTATQGSTEDFIKAGGDNILDGDETTTQQDEVVGDEEGEGQGEEVEGEEEAGDTAAEDSTDPASSNPDAELRAAIAEEFGLDEKNPKHKTLIDGYVKEAEEMKVGDGETDFEKSLKSRKPVPAEAPKAPPPSSTRQAADNGEVPFDAGKHYYKEARLYGVAFGPGEQTTEERNEAIASLEQLRVDEAATFFVRFASHKSFLDHIIKQVRATIDPDMAPVRELANSTRQLATRQRATNRAITELVKADESLGGFIKRQAADQPSPYEKILRDNPELNDISPNKDWSSYSPDEQAVLLEMKRIKLARKLVKSAPTPKDKVAAIRKMGQAHASGKQAALKDVLKRVTAKAAGRSGGPAAGGGSAPATYVGELTAHAKRTGGIFGN